MRNIHYYAYSLKKYKLYSGFMKNNETSFINNMSVVDHYTNITSSGFIIINKSGFRLLSVDVLPRYQAAAQKKQIYLNLASGRNIKP